LRRETFPAYTGAENIQSSWEELIPEPLSLTVSLRGTREVRNNCQIFRLTGLLDAFSEPVLRKVLGKFVEEIPKHVILDLCRIDFIDSAGLGALIQLVKKVQSNQVTLQMVTNPRVTQTVKLVHLEKFFSLQPSLEAALANLKTAS